MIKQIILVSVLSILTHKIYRYMSFMGYLNDLNVLDELEPSECHFKFRNIVENRYNYPIKNTIDSDLLPNGLSIFISSNKYPFENILDSDRNDFNIFMLDMNFMLEPIRLKIFNSARKQLDSSKSSDFFNLFALSIYQDDESSFKIIAANYINNQYKFEKFLFDGNFRSIVHLNTFEFDLDQLCDLVAVDDYLFYFTKCYSNSFLKNMKLNLEIKNGEIWLFDSKQKVAYMVANNLFLPKSIAYLSSDNLLIVTNQAIDGITLFKREFDNSLTRLEDIRLNSFVFNINIDSNDGSLWLILHPILHRTINLDKSSPSQLARVILDLRYTSFIKYDIEYFFSTKGSLIDSLSSSLVFQNNLILFSFLNDPKICKIK